MSSSASTSLTVHVSLRRAHVLAERIAERMAALRGQAVTHLAPVSVHLNRGPVLDDAQFELSATAGLTALERFQEYAELLAQVRATLAQANAASGVSTKLGLIEQRKKSIALLKTVLGGLSAPGLLSRERLRQHLESPEQAAPAPAHVVAVQVSVLAEQPLARLRAELEALERTLFAEQDELAELNATRIVLDFPAHLAEELGLAQSSAPAPQAA